MEQKIISLEFKRNKKKESLRYRKKLIENKFPKLCIMKIKNNGDTITIVGTVVKSLITRDDIKKDYVLLIFVKLWKMLSNTLIDKHGEKISKDALKKAETTMKKYYLPLYKEHDFTNPPIGILLDAEVIDVDGESYLYADYKIFSKEDIGNKSNLDKKMYISYEEKNTLSFDRNFKIDKELKKLIEELKSKEKDFNFKITDNIKKSLEFTPEIVIAFVVGGIFTGFLGKMGGDLFDHLIVIIKKLFEKNSNTNLHVILLSQKKLPNGKIIEIKTIIILDRNYKELDVIIDEYIENFMMTQLEKIITESLPISRDSKFFETLG